MKKLMFAAAVAVAALCSQAASINWYLTSSGEEVHNGTTTGYANGATAYAVYFLDGEYGFSQNDLLDGLRKGKTMTDFASYLVSPDTATVAGNVLPKTKITGADDSYLSTDRDISAYVVLIQDGKVFLQAEEYFLYDDMDETLSVIGVNSMATKFTRDTDATKAFGSDGWYTTSTVPEPTSGLLLLLGVAGLALRRRRA